MKLQMRKFVSVARYILDYLTLHPILEVPRPHNTSDKICIYHALVLRFFALTPRANLHHLLICALSLPVLAGYDPLRLPLISDGNTLILFTRTFQESNYYVKERLGGI